MCSPKRNDEIYKKEELLTFGKLSEEIFSERKKSNRKIFPRKGLEKLTLLNLCSIHIDTFDCRIKCCKQNDINLRDADDINWKTPIHNVEIARKYSGNSIEMKNR